MRLSLGPGRRVPARVAIWSGQAVTLCCCEGAVDCIVEGPGRRVPTRVAFWSGQAVTLGCCEGAVDYIVEGPGRRVPTRVALSAAKLLRGSMWISITSTEFY